MIVMTAPAMTAREFVLNVPDSSSRPAESGSMFLSGSMTRAHRNEFQYATNSRMANAAMVGVASGSMMRRQMVSSRAPSMRAASMSSCGIPRYAWRSRNRPTMLAAPGSTTARYCRAASASGLVCASRPSLMVVM